MQVEHGGSLVWEYTLITNSKQYYISQKDYAGNFGTADVISPVSGSSGDNRFYIMALNNFTTTDYETFYWYYEASSNSSLIDTQYVSSNSVSDFGEGYNNTKRLIDVWNNNIDYQNERDLWGVIQDEYKKGWFVPSKSEWAAFQNIYSLDIGDFFLSSSTIRYYNPVYAIGPTSYMCYLYDGYGPVRLSTTF